MILMGWPNNLPRIPRPVGFLVLLIHPLRSISSHTKPQNIYGEYTVNKMILIAFNQNEFAKHNQGRKILFWFYVIVVGICFTCLCYCTGSICWYDKNINPLVQIYYIDTQNPHWRNVNNNFQKKQNFKSHAPLRNNNHHICIAK